MHELLHKYTGKIKIEIRCFLIEEALTSDNKTVTWKTERTFPLVYYPTKGWVVQSTSVRKAWVVVKALHPDIYQMLETEGPDSDLAISWITSDDAGIPLQQEDSLTQIALLPQLPEITEVVVTFQ